MGLWLLFGSLEATSVPLNPINSGTFVPRRGPTGRDILSLTMGKIFSEMV